MDIERINFINVSLYCHNLEGGGAERSMVILANSLFELGYSVELVLNQLSGVYFDELNSSIKVISLESRRRTSHILRLSNYLKNKRPVVLISTIVAPNYWAILANIISGKHSKHILREANTPHIEFKKSNLKRKLGFSLARLVYRFADACVGNSADSVKSIQQFYKLNRDKVHLIYNGIPTDNIRQLAKESILHKWINRKDINLIVAVGRIVEQKNHKMLIKTLAFLNKHDKSYRLIIIGSRGQEKGYEEELDQLIAEHNLFDQVDFLEFTPNPFTYMSKADIFVLSSRWEGFPSVLVQSMACGTQVIGTDCPGATREILADGKYGALVPVDNWKAMGDAIIIAQKNQYDPELLIDRAKEFSVEKNVHGYSHLIEELLKSKQH